MTIFMYLSIKYFTKWISDQKFNDIWLQRIVNRTDMQKQLKSQVADFYKKGLNNLIPKVLICQQ